MEKVLKTLTIRPHKPWPMPVIFAAFVMRVLLDEHETILSSYQAQKYGGGEGSTGEVAQVSRTLGKNWQEEERLTTSTRSDAKRVSSEEVRRDRQRQPCEGDRHMTCKCFGKQK